MKEKEINAIRIGNIYNPNYGKSFAGNVWSVKGISPTLKCESGGGNRQPLIYERTSKNNTIRKTE